MRTGILTVKAGLPSSSIPSSTSPYIPSKYHLTTAQSTLIATPCFWMIVLVERPVKSCKSAGERRV